MKFSGNIFSSDRLNCNYNINRSISIDGYVSSDFHIDGISKGGGFGYRLMFNYKLNKC